MGSFLPKSKRSRSLVLIVLVIVVGSYLLFFGPPWKPIALKKQFEVYLEDRYQKDFTLKKIDFDFIHRTYHSLAHPGDDPSLHFYVGQDISSKEINDAYPQEVWKQEANEELTPWISKLFTASINHSIETQTSYELSSDELVQLPEYKKAVSVRIGINMRNTEISDNNKDKELELVLQFLTLIREETIRVSYLAVDYGNKTLRVNYEQIKEVNSILDLENLLPN
ncbi:hypothetical protein J7E73_24780 [Paenibacillus albidus]|uniref:hypothetical protein n=1 Tax=Paenibacillus albidus TaxID=2041023 RepID=UPI001BEBA109|nr:hypothetical protein [Paenibacillus albidus]MBT2292284.1 hypothetical protein [Paenibacillus albidus]